MSLDLQKTFVFTMDDLIYESYKTLTGENKVSKKSIKFKNYQDSKLKNQSKFVHKFGDNINASYVDRVCNTKYNGKKNRILFVSLSGKISYDDIISTIVDKRVLNLKEKRRYIIFMFGVLPELRNKGLGRFSLEKYYDFIDKKKSKTEIILHSLKSSLEFYKKLGYQDVQINYFLMRYEQYNIENKDKIILLKIIINKVHKINVYSYSPSILTDTLLSRGGEVSDGASVSGMVQTCALQRANGGGVIEPGVVSLT